MRKKRSNFVGVTVMLPTNSDKVISSEFFISTFTSFSEFSYGLIQDFKEGKTTKEDLIFTVTGIKKEEDMLAYATFSDVVDYLMGRFGKKNLKEIVTLKNPIDITRIFDTDEKFDTFLAYMMKHSMENHVRGANPFLPINNSFNVDSSYMLKIIEDMLVDIYDADRVGASRFMYKFLGYYNMFFLYMCVFKLMHKVLSMRIPDVTYVTKTKKEMIKSYIPAVYKFEENVFIQYRQIQFSKLLLEERLKENEENYGNNLFNFRLYHSFLDDISKVDFEQIAWGKEANMMIKDGEIEVEPFYKF